MTPSPRKPIGILLLLFGLVLYAGLVAMAAPWLAQLPGLAVVPVYLFLGLIWLVPLGPLLRWMATGCWTAPK